MINISHNVLLIPFIGGMTVAFHDVILLSSLLEGVDLWDTQQMKQVVKKFHSQRKSHACVLNTLAHGIYTIFSADPGKFNIYIYLLYEIS
jgi:2-polyprenyl-6-methoxyphenol hydroxylase-like FAD-dependent oxidoreductase